jgi:hypothetical protein
MRRREFIGLTGGAVLWPLAVRAQQPTIPVIGFVHLTSPEAREREVLAAFHRGPIDFAVLRQEIDTRLDQAVLEIFQISWGA